MNNHKIKAVIFDMDGVLIDAKDWHYESLNRALGLFGFDISRHEHLVTYDGLPTRQKLEMLTLERGLPSSLHKLINDLKQKYTMEIVHTQCRPAFHHQYAINKLKNSSFSLAVCSNSIRQTVDKMLERAGILESMDLTLSNEDVSKAKPDPEIYSKAIHLLGLTPPECLIVEDNQNGVRAAMSAGAHVLVVQSTTDVNFSNIMKKINQLDSKNA